MGEKMMQVIFIIPKAFFKPGNRSPVVVKFGTLILTSKRHGVPRCRFLCFCDELTVFATLSIEKIVLRKLISRMFWDGRPDVEFWFL